MDDNDFDKEEINIMTEDTVPIKKTTQPTNRMLAMMGGQPSDRSAEIEDKARRALNKSGLSHSQLDRSSVKSVRSSLKRGGP